MSKRKPKSGDVQPKKPEVLSTRITTELRADLQKSAERNQRTISTEVEHRLRRSYDADQRLSDITGFDDEQSFAQFRLLSAVISMTAKEAGAYVRKARRGSDSRWQEDAYVYDQVYRAVVGVMEIFRPPGDTSRPLLPEEKKKTNQGKVVTQSMEVIGEGMAWGLGVTARLLAAIRDSDGEFPLTKQKHDTEFSYLAKKLSAELGSLVGRIPARNETDQLPARTVRKR